MSVDAVPVERLNAAQAFGRLIATARGREMMRRNGYRNGMAVLPADEDEAMVDVLDRIEAHGGAPAVLAVHFPNRRGNEALVLVEWRGVSFEPREGANFVPFKNADAGSGSTVGMVVDAIRGRRSFGDRLTEMMSEISPSYSVFA